jgi:hypothetical protein
LKDENKKWKQAGGRRKIKVINKSEDSSVRNDWIAIEVS